MRLSEKNLLAIKESFVQVFLPDDHLWLFGSRVDDTKKGGDIDLYVETHLNTWKEILQKKRDLSVAIQLRIGEQKIDIVIKSLKIGEHLAIFDEARKTGILLV